MKKKGFTLAEILVSLGIIGVVAAIVLPTFISSHKQQVHEATRKSAESVFENALSAMMADEFAEDLSFTKIWAEQKNNSQAREIFGEYMKFTSTDPDQYMQQGVGMMLKSGAVISFDIKDKPNNDEAAMMKIDTNGKAEPNKTDVDIYNYRLGYNGALHYIKGYGN